LRNTAHNMTAATHSSKNCFLEPGSAAIVASMAWSVEITVASLKEKRASLLSNSRDWGAWEDICPGVEGCKERCQGDRAA